MREVDVVVVVVVVVVGAGAGSAAAVLAERLTADERLRVLLLEAGGQDRRFWIRMPIGYGGRFFDRRVNWASPVRQHFYAAARDRAAYYQQHERS